MADLWTRSGFKFHTMLNEVTDVPVHHWLADFWSDLMVKPGGYRAPGQTMPIIANFTTCMVSLHAKVINLT